MQEGELRTKTLNECHDLSVLLSVIHGLDEEIRVKSTKLLFLKNDFLRRSGWEITRELVGPTDSYFYSKFGELFVCEDEAIDREINGAYTEGL
jgi:hypothetical protein